MSTVVSNIKDAEYGYPKRLFVKGASEMILDCCTHFIDENGNRQVKTKENQDLILEKINDYAGKALRCICLAYKDLKEGECGLKHDHKDKGDHLFAIEKSGLTCIAILGIKDIIRPEVPDAVE